MKLERCATAGLFYHGHAQDFAAVAAPLSVASTSKGAKGTVLPPPPPSNEAPPLQVLLLGSGPVYNLPAIDWFGKSSPACCGPSLMCWLLLTSSLSASPSSLFLCLSLSPLLTWLPTRLKAVVSTLMDNKRTPQEVREAREA